MINAMVADDERTATGLLLCIQESSNVQNVPEKNTQSVMHHMPTFTTVSHRVTRFSLKCSEII